MKVDWFKAGDWDPRIALSCEKMKYLHWRFL